MSGPPKSIGATTLLQRPTLSGIRIVELPDAIPERNRLAPDIAISSDRGVHTAPLRTFETSIGPKVTTARPNRNIASKSVPADSYFEPMTAAAMAISIEPTKNASQCGTGTQG